MQSKRSKAPVQVMDITERFQVYDALYGQATVNVALLAFTSSTYRRPVLNANLMSNITKKRHHDED